MPTVNIGKVFDDLAEEIANISEGHGFWSPEDVGDMGIIPLKLLLISSEVVEALDIHRKEYDDSDEDSGTRLTEMQTEDFLDELADVIIRALDIGGYYGLELGDAIIDKVARNAERPHLHGKRY